MEGQSAREMEQSANWGIMGISINPAVIKVRNFRQ